MLHLRLPLAVILLLGAVLALSSAPVRAQDADAFTVTEVPVDVRAANAVAAREEALMTGQREAFKRLIERLASAEAAQRLSQLSDAQITELVRDFTIDEERASAVRYIAQLTFRFHPESVRRVLREANVAFTDTQARPLLVLPVYSADGRAPVLWDDPNPWRAAWAARPSGGLVPLVVPMGDLADVVTLDAAQALAGNIERLTALAQRYGTADVLVAVADATNTEGDGPARVEVRMVPYGPAVPQLFERRSYTAQEGEELRAMFDRITRDVADALNNTYKEMATPRQENLSSLSALVPLEGLNDWLAVRDMLNRLALVRGFEVVSLSRDEAALVLHHTGDRQQLEQLLASNGWALHWEGGFWQLRRAGNSPFPALLPPSANQPEQSQLPPLR
ncbi:DUF2066 domain-containing protein [Telmatospirillum sp. J64-1]|uniref:DUF2066 domain-containing protein n=1 Tax=Telmatospirillum sp. J64-1 TaxID=2502183 RepID=UPI00163D77AD|nr:DUF2066 domain-containing protein [Telmatospirillum sp. J64-1]